MSEIVVESTRRIISAIHCQDTENVRAEAIKLSSGTVCVSLKHEGVEVALFITPTQTERLLKLLDNAVNGRAACYPDPGIQQTSDSTIAMTL